MNEDIKYRILNFIRIRGPISRVSIAERLGLSTSAITTYIASLLNENLIKETGTEESSGGRKAILLRINRDCKRVISVDFGQGFFRIALMDTDSNILCKNVIESNSLSPQEKGLPKIASMINEMKANVQMEGNELIGIGIGTSAIIDYSNDICSTISNLQGWNNAPLKKILEEEFKVPVFMDDSSRLHALAESACDKEHGRTRNLIFINLGVGIGSGVIIDWKLLKGKNGLAGELGHIIVEENGYLCGCGNRGCLEQYLSTTALVRRVKSALREGVQSAISSYINNDYNLVDPHLISRAVKEKDKLAYSIILEAGKYLGIGLSHIITLFNPDRVIIGGGGANIANEMIEESIRIMHLRAVNLSATNVKISKSIFGEDGCLIGAAIMVLDHYFKLDRIINDDFFDK